MKKASFLIIISVFCLLVLQAGEAVQWDATKFMLLSEIKPGMKGEAYTVFSGTTVEKFDFEVISIEYNFQPQWHVIWVKGSGQNFEKTGGAGGMSGSPGYINGRLMGALSLAYFNQREHANIVGFTPIELMVEVTQRGMHPNLSYRGGNLFQFASDAAQGALELLPLSHDKPPTKSKRGMDAPLNPSVDFNSALLQTPVAFSAMNPQALGFLKPLFDTHRLIPIQGVGGGSPVKGAPIEPGQVVGIEFVRGDFSAFGYGTMTYIDGDQMIAFGHPMFGEGNVNLPISGGYVHFILPSIARSFKVASPTQPIGTLVQDRQPAIAGLIGSYPGFIPVNAQIETIDGKTHPMHYEVIPHRDFSALYAMVGVWSLIDALEISGGDHTINIDTKISLKGQSNLASREIALKNVYSSSGSPGLQAARSLLPLSSLIGNDYAKVAVEGVNVNIKIEDKRKTATIEGIRIDKDRYRPGEEVQVMMTLRPYLEEPIVQTGRIRIPRDVPEGPITLLAIAGSSYEDWQRVRAPLNYRPTNINQLIKLLQRGENNSDIILELFTPTPGMTVQGQEFPELPLSMFSVMSSPTQSGEGGYTRGTTVHAEKVATKYVIDGSQFLRFTIDSNAP